MKQKLFIIAPILAALDVAALFVPATKADLYLRPLAVLAFVVTAWLSPSVRGAIFLRLGLVFALFVETTQRLDLPTPYVVFGTAGTYVLYSIYFALRGGIRLSPLSLLPFAVAGIYAVSLFVWFEPYGLLRTAAMAYVPVAVFMTGLGAQGFLYEKPAGKTGLPALAGSMRFWIGLGTVILLISDSVRAFTIFKTEFFRFEAVIMALYFLGIYSLVRSIREENK